MAANIYEEAVVIKKIVLYSFSIVYCALCLAVVIRLLMPLLAAIIVERRAKKQQQQQHDEEVEEYGDAIVGHPSSSGGYYYSTSSTTSFVTCGQKCNCSRHWCIRFRHQLSRFFDVQLEQLEMLAQNIGRVDIFSRTKAIFYAVLLCALGGRAASFVMAAVSVSHSPVASAVTNPRRWLLPSGDETPSATRWLLFSGVQSNPVFNCSTVFIYSAFFVLMIYWAERFFTSHAQSIQCARRRLSKPIAVLSALALVILTVQLTLVILWVTARSPSLTNIYGAILDFYHLGCASAITLFFFIWARYTTVHAWTDFSDDQQEIKSAKRVLWCVLGLWLTVVGRQALCVMMFFFSAMGYFSQIIVALVAHFNKGQKQSDSDLPQFWGFIVKEVAYYGIVFILFDVLPLMFSIHMMRFRLPDQDPFLLLRSTINKAFRRRGRRGHVVDANTYNLSPASRIYAYVSPTTLPISIIKSKKSEEEDEESPLGTLNKSSYYCCCYGSTAVSTTTITTKSDTAKEAPGENNKNNEEEEEASNNKKKQQKQQKYQQQQQQQIEPSSAQMMMMMMTTTTTTTMGSPPHSPLETSF